MSKRISISKPDRLGVHRRSRTDIHSRVRLHIHDAPLIGTIAFAIRRYLGIWLVYFILKPGRS